MGRPQNPVPSYRLHRQSGQAIVTLREPSGKRRDVLLGEYDSDESREAYARELAEWQARGGFARKKARNRFTVEQLVKQYWVHAKSHYRTADGKPTSELSLISRAGLELTETYGSTAAAEFGPLALKAIQGQLARTKIEGTEHTISRQTVNKYIDRIRRMFRWAVAEELIRSDVYEALKAVPGLKRGRCDAREAEPIKAVHPSHVQATLPSCGKHVAGMIRLQMVTGMRPGETCRMRLCDIDRSGDIWIYRPETHKNEWRGKDRVIPLGPRAQAIVNEFITTDLSGYLFNPQEEQRLRIEAMRAKRLSKVQPSQFDRSKPNAKRKPGVRFNKDSYARAVARAIVKANRKKSERLKRDLQPHEQIPHWHPNQLRHLRATQVRGKFGLDGAQVSLGHSSADVTQVYAELDIAKAAKIAKIMG